MQADIKAAKNSDCRDLVSRLTLKANPENVVDQLKLSLVAYALLPVSKDSRDEMFDEWLKTRITEYCKRNNVTIVRQD